ncbi:hypothetical protein E2C01_083334 [Portunus trituberculatus]|uniref:Uncharacterized protein n=1 Tax=Portunus trituberculatus TaxID=210409 RepID=A0A5B7IWX7_PORTR|nr:hypothetical protein [Portunus trituberculatus]
MVPKKLISDENKESWESASVSEPLVDSQESHQEKLDKDVFVDGDSSSSDLPPPPHPSPLF